MSNGNNIWVDVKDKLPDFDVNVLCYYEFNGTDKEKTLYRVITIGHLAEVRTGKSYKYPEWKDDQHEDIKPTHWMPLPEPPPNS